MKHVKFKAYFSAFLLSFSIALLEYIRILFDKISFTTIIFQLSTHEVFKCINDDWTLYVISFIKSFSLIFLILFLCTFIVKQKKILYYVYLIGFFVSILMTLYCLDFHKWLVNCFRYSTIYEDYYVSAKDTEIVFPEDKRNLIVVYLESVEYEFGDENRIGNNFIPNLTDYANENITFSNTTNKLGGGVDMNGLDFSFAALLGGTAGISYNVSSYTTSYKEENDDRPETRGILEVLDKYDNVDFMGNVSTLGDILKDNGYKNYYLLGTSDEFSGKNFYLNQHGYIVKDKDAIKEYMGKEEDDIIFFVGYPDRILYDYSKYFLNDIAKDDEPFYVTISTVDTHFPEGYLCNLCTNAYSSNYANVMNCADRQIYDFIEWCKKQDWYENTTIVLMGDHCFMSTCDLLGNYSDSRGIYNCFINSNFKNTVEEKNTVNRIYNITDMFPTVLASIGVDIKGDRLGLGTNLVSDKKTLSEEKGVEWVNNQLGMNSRMYKDEFNISLGN